MCIAVLLGSESRGVFRRLEALLVPGRLGICPRAVAAVMPPRARSRSMAVASRRVAVLPPMLAA
eukprot:15155861-Alexandrium_andersonii.AAC.1